MRYALMRFSDDIDEEKLFLRWVGELRGVRWGCPGFHRQLSLNSAFFWSTSNSKPAPHHNDVNADGGWVVDDDDRSYKKNELVSLSCLSCIASLFRGPENFHNAYLRKRSMTRMRILMTIESLAFFWWLGKFQTEKQMKGSCHQNSNQVLSQLEQPEIIFDQKCGSYLIRIVDHIWLYLWIIFD